MWKTATKGGGALLGLWPSAQNALLVDFSLFHSISLRMTQTIWDDSFMREFPWNFYMNWTFLLQPEETPPVGHWWECRFGDLFSLFLSINSRSVFLIHYFEALQLYWGQKYLRILEKAPPQSEKTQGSSSIAAGLTPDEVQLWTVCLQRLVWFDCVTSQLQAAWEELSRLLSHNIHSGEAGTKFTAWRLSSAAPSNSVVLSLRVTD